MKRLLLSTFFAALCLAFTAAQEPATGVPKSSARSAAADTTSLMQAASDIDITEELMPTLYLPDPYYISPWQLHSGLNAQFGMNVSVGFGKHSPKGMGIGSTSALIYALPLSSRLAIAGGVGMNTLDWGGWKVRDAVVMGAMAYKVNDMVSTYVYGEKSLVPHGQKFCNYPGFAKDKVGGGVKLNFGDNMFIQVGVSRGNYDY